MKDCNHCGERIANSRDECSYCKKKVGNVEVVHWSKKNKFYDKLETNLVLYVLVFIAIVAFIAIGFGWLDSKIGHFPTLFIAMALAYFGDRWQNGLPLFPRLGPKRISGTVKKNLNVDDNIHTDTIGYGSNRYQIFLNPTGLTEAVKDGWSWPGCLLSSFWLIYKGIIGLGVGSFIFFLILPFLGLPILDILITFIFVIYLGSNGNKIVTNSLIQKGYKFVINVNADSAEGAKAQFVVSQSKDK